MALLKSSDKKTNFRNDSICYGGQYNALEGHWYRPGSGRTYEVKSTNEKRRRARENAVLYSLKRPVHSYVCSV